MRTLVRKAALVTGLALSFLTGWDASALDHEVAGVSADPIALSAVHLTRAPGVAGANSCSGVLVAPRWVLAVAHCADGLSSRAPGDRDRTIPVANRPRAQFRSEEVDAKLNLSEDISIDRVVRVDGSATGSNSVALFHLASAAPVWATLAVLHRGELPGSDEDIQIFGWATGDRKGGTVHIASKEWRSSVLERFWALNLRAAPSQIRRGDSGGPLYVTRDGQQRLVGVNWRTANASHSGGRGAATFDIFSDGHLNPVGTLIEQIIFPGAVIAEGLYEVKAEHSNKCLTVFHNSTADFAKLIQFDCARRGNQLWRFSPLGNGTYLVRPAHSGKCLTAGSAPTHPGINLVQGRCIVPASHNAWLLRHYPHYGRSTYEFQVWGDGVCADVERSGMDNDADVIFYPCTRAQNQRWILTRVGD